MKPALLALDLQNDFFAADNPNLAGFQRTIPTINAAIALFRQRGWPIIFIQHTSKNKPVGSRAWQVHRSFDCRPEDRRIHKGHMNAFWDSELDTALKLLGVGLVVIVGYVSEFCVLSTFRGAGERGYKNTILKDGIASLDEGRTQFTLDISTTTTLDELATTK